MADNAAADNDGWVFPNQPKIQCYICSLMSFKHNCWDNKYPMGTTFTKQKEDPDWRTDCPLYEEADSLSKAKHGVSVYMPNQHADWINGRGGNTTKHQLVLNIISDIRALETKGKGHKPNDKQPYRQPKFDKMLEILWAFCNFNN